MNFKQIIPNDTLRRLNPHIFCGEPPRATTGVTSEASLHDQIFDLCRQRVWIALHGSMAERSHRTLGEPDFTILADRGRVLFVECKSRTGKLSPAQQALKLHAETLGHTIHLVRSYDEFLTLL